MHQSPRILPVYTMITQQNCRLLNNALLNYCSPPGQVLVCFVRWERTENVAKGKEALEFSHFEISSMAKVALLHTRGSKPAANVLYFMGHRHQRMGGTAEGGGPLGAYMLGVRFLSCTWKHFPKSATVGEEDGAVQRKAPVGFLPVHRCHSPHSRLIQSHRHQMP